MHNAYPIELELWYRTIIRRAQLAIALSLVFVFIVADGQADDLDDLDPSSTLPLTSELPACDASIGDIPLRTERGSAGVMYNLAEHPESLRAVATDLLQHAVDASVQALKTSCAMGCSTDRIDKIVFKVSPIVYRPKQKQQALCLQLADETRKRPLVYAEREFGSVEQFDAWLVLFTQGIGADGKLLYEQCGGNCDPSDIFIIETNSPGFKVNTEVFCGFARNRANGDMFEISTQLRPRCDRTLGYSESP